MYPRPRKIAQLVNACLEKYEDLSLIPKHKSKSQTWWPTLLIPGLEQWRKADLWEHLQASLAKLVIFRPKRPCLKTERLAVLEE